MYKPKIDNTQLNKGYSVIKDNNENTIACNLFIFNNEIFEEIKKIPLKKLSFEESCKISDFKFLNDFSCLEEVIISFNHKEIDISDFNYLKNIQKLGIPNFKGVFSNTNIRKLSFCWGKNAKFAKGSLNINDISIHKCNNISSCINEIANISGLQNVHFFQCDFSNFFGNSKMKNVTSLTFQNCEILTMEWIGNVFTNCKSLLFENIKGFENYNGLEKLHKLETLCITSSLPIKDFSFLEKLPSLKTLKIISTKIETNCIENIKKIPNAIFYMTGKDKKLSK